MTLIVSTNFIYGMLYPYQVGEAYGLYNQCNVKWNNLGYC